MPSHLPPDFAITHFLSEGNLGLDLINSEHFDYRGRRLPQDMLEDHAWLTAWTQHWQLPVTPPPDTLSLATLHALRALLRCMVVDLAAQQPISETHLEILNTFLALAPVHQQVKLVSGGVRLVSLPLQAGWMSVVTQVAVSWADLLSRTALERLKVCANPACHWVFLDQSHNLSRRWCRQWACGNLMKVRQFRARRANRE
ncbi:MAG TPA: CGNR zinc finger domain-containing protein [Ktedonobacterales bacterium]|jgi:predicted RNA-binding Zn ribbon-like protein